MKYAGCICTFALIKTTTTWMRNCSRSWFVNETRLKDKQVSQCDLVVIGAGHIGLPAAHVAARLGAKVALIEIREVGEI